MLFNFQTVWPVFNLTTFAFAFFIYFSFILSDVFFIRAMLQGYLIKVLRTSIGISCTESAVWCGDEL